MADLLTKKPAHSEGWYWSRSDTDSCYGPFETREIAADQFWHDGDGQDAFNDLEGDNPGLTKEAFLAQWEYISYLHKRAISTDVFDADIALENFAEKNEDAIWQEGDWPEWSNAEAKRELELMLADALYRWAEKHDAWQQFRALA
jgi:hypothetical protein